MTKVAHPRLRESFGVVLLYFTVRPGFVRGAMSHDFGTCGRREGRSGLIPTNVVASRVSCEPESAHIRHSAPYSNLYMHLPWGSQALHPPQTSKRCIISFHRTSEPTLLNDKIPHIPL